MVQTEPLAFFHDILRHSQCRFDYSNFTEDGFAAPIVLTVWLWVSKLTPFTIVITMFNTHPGIYTYAQKYGHFTSVDVNPHLSQFRNLMSDALLVSSVLLEFDVNQMDENRFSRTERRNYITWSRGDRLRVELSGIPMRYTRYLIHNGRYPNFKRKPACCCRRSLSRVRVYVSFVRSRTSATSSFFANPRRTR